MLSVQEIYEHVSKNISIPDHWKSKNYAFGFVSLMKEEMLNDWRNSMFHKLIGDESTEISVSKMFIIYLKYRKLDEISYYKIFRGINIWRMIKLT